ncbi:MAG: hypothetical protein WCD66_06465, partial [Rhodanobacteraceae bacterium]
MNQEIRGFLDGQLVATTTYTGQLNIKSNSLFKVGGSGNANGMASGQLLDEFRLYDHALNNQQVLATAFTQLNQNGTGLTYVWSNGGPDNDTICFSAQQSGPIMVDVYDQNGCVGSDTFNLHVNPEIVVDAGKDTAICKNSSIQIGGAPTGSGGYGNLSYSWAPNERILTSDTVANPTVGPLYTTTYTVTVTDGHGCNWSDAITVKVNPVPFADAGGDIEICHGDSVVIGGTPAASGGTGPYTYSWTPTVGLNNTSIANPTAKPDTTTMYTLLVTDMKGCTDDSLMKVVVHPLPDVTIDPVSAMCVNASPMMLHAGSPGGTWSGDGITDGTLGMFDPSVAGAGMHKVKYTNMTSFGCTATDSTMIQVNPLPTPQITGDLNHCIEEGVFTLTATPTGGTWSGSGIIDANAGTFDPVTAGLGSHAIVYAYADSIGCTGYDTAMITISEAPRVSVNPAGPYCQSDAADTLVGTPSGGTWSGDGITDVNVGIFDPSVAGVGTHTITYTYVDPVGCTVTASVTIEVEGVAGLAINPAGPFCQEGASTVLSANVGGGYWSGAGIVNPLNGEFKPAAAGPGNHTISYTVTGAQGCVTLAKTDILVNASPNTTIGQAGPFCADESPVTLSAVTGGGTWSGTGIT